MIVFCAETAQLQLQQSGTEYMTANGFVVGRDTGERVPVLIIWDTTCFWVCGEDERLCGADSTQPYPELRGYTYNNLFFWGEMRAVDIIMRSQGNTGYFRSGEYKELFLDDGGFCDMSGWDRFTE